MNIGLAYQEMGNHDAAIIHLRDANEYYVENEMIPQARVSGMKLAISYWHLGEAEKGDQVFELVSEALNKGGFTPSEVSYFFDLAVAVSDAGQLGACRVTDCFGEGSV